MERTLCVSESMRKNPITKFKTILFTSVGFIKKVCFNSPHTYS